MTLLVSGFGEDGGGLYVVQGHLVEAIDELDTTGLAVSPDGQMLARTLAGHHTPDADGHLLVYDPQGVRWYRRCPEVTDPHGIVWTADERFAVASTGANAVQWLSADGAVVQERRFGDRRDAWHLNCPAVGPRGALVATIFDRGEEAVSWRAALVAREPAGMVIDIETGERLFGGLVGPHDPLLREDGSWLVNNSGLQEVLWLDRDGSVTRRVHLGAWTRGLCVDERTDTLWVGLSVRRYEDPEGRAQLVELDLRTGEERSRTALPFEEVFSIVQIGEPLLTGVRLGFSGLPGWGATLATLNHPGLERTDDPLSPADMQIDLRVERVPTSVPAGSWQRAELTIGHCGRTPFTSVGDKPVRMAARWFDTDGALLPLEGRGTLPRVLAPGGTMTGMLTYEVPTTPGAYTVEMTLVQEFHAWFSDQPGPAQSVRVPVEVT